MSDQNAVDLEEMATLIASAKQLAKRYRALTGRPLGITGEVAEYEAARILGLELAPARQAGFDAMRRTGNTVDRLQIKARCVLSKNGSQRVGKIDLNKEWDGVLLVLLDSEFAPIAIYEARRANIEEALKRPGSKARNERGALSVSKFRAIARMIWPDAASQQKQSFNVDSTVGS
ncbi:hypothetical protein LMG18090_01250 [Ralstonia mannitolilytica]|uniref:DUF6998 domain-containing protein n=1 Tax=Ralstonia mannitolilytica TaxID=105219 RepID=UPI0028F4D92E|nr:hypothetical protein [Ralstonia mannitolilytica]CAJ0780902.1 hypothetical protein LMG18090_01250 [Ralstonia mannitolilytica]